MLLFDARPGSLTYKAGELAKRIVFRSKWLNFLSRPRFPLFGMQPAQLAWLVNKIDDTRLSNKTPGTIVEVGVGLGMTTIFLLEHMKVGKDTRPYYCIDTFGGFLEKDVDFEATKRGKDRREIEGKFAYNSKQIFENNLKKCGYTNPIAICADASAMDFSTIAPIDVMLLDVDLFIPTKAVLTNIMKHLNTRAYIMVDDCQPNSLWDGSDQAYNEFLESQGRPRVIVGTKGGVFEKVQSA
jgi:hypothetical protein